MRGGRTRRDVLRKNRRRYYRELGASSSYSPDARHRLKVSASRIETGMKTRGKFVVQ